MPLSYQDFRDRLLVPFAGAQILPVIGDGNCAFRGQIQSAIVEASFTTEKAKKLILINFLKRIYEKNHETAVALRLSGNKTYSDLSQIQKDFKEFFAAVRSVTFDNINDFWNKVCLPYFPTELNDDALTYKYPAKDDIVKFLAYCLRIELATELPEGSLGLNNDRASTEYNSVDLSFRRGALVNYLQRTYRIFPAIFFEGQDVYDASDKGSHSATIYLRHRLDHYDLVLTPTTCAAEQEVRRLKIEQLRLNARQEQAALANANTPQQRPEVLLQFNNRNLNRGITRSLVFLGTLATVGCVANRLRLMDK